MAHLSDAITKHMAKKMAVRIGYVATVLLNLRMISMLPSEGKKMSSKFRLKTVR